jgi:hypothetical protein
MWMPRVSAPCGLRSLQLESVGSRNRVELTHLSLTGPPGLGAYPELTALLLRKSKDLPVHFGQAIKIAPSVGPVVINTGIEKNVHLKLLAQVDSEIAGLDAPCIQGDRRAYWLKRVYAVRRRCPSFTDIHAPVFSYPLCLDTLANTCVRQKLQLLSAQPRPHTHKKSGAAVSFLPKTVN